MRKIRRRNNKKGMGTVEVVIIVAVLVALALLFRAGLTEYGQKVMAFCFDDSKIESAFCPFAFVFLRKHRAFLNHVFFRVI